MEDKFYKNNFEQFLRDTTDEFLMVPSRKVWYGIYNDMHPDRKWPSMAVCLLILSAVLYIGVSNNNSLSGAARKSAAENLSDLAKNYISEQNAGSAGKQGISSQTGLPQFYLRNNKTTQIPLNGNGNLTPLADLLNSEVSEDVSLADPRQTNISATQDNAVADISFTNSSPLTNFEEAAAPRVNTYSGSAGKTNRKQNILSEVPDTGSSEISISGAADNIELTINNKTTSLSEKETAPLKAQEKSALKSAVENEKSWREDFAFKNKPKMTKFRERATISYYFTPSIGFRSLTQIRENQITLASPAQRSAAVSSVANPSYNVESIYDSKGMNLEAGAAVLYALSDKVKLKSGLQAGYTNYTSSVTFIGHTVQTELASDKNSDRIRSAVFSTAPGSDRLNKSTLQISMPVGADIKIAGNHKIKWYVGATLQPTYILNGSAYVFSADQKYYISDRSLLRKWNMNTAVETFVSFRPSPSVTLTVGPQFRYQVLSSFKKEYNYSEKLYNTGLKVGIITGL